MAAGIVIGLFIGTALGFILCSILVVSRDGHYIDAKPMTLNVKDQDRISIENGGEIRR